MTTATVDIDLGSYKLGWSDPEDDYVFKPEKGLNEELVSECQLPKYQSPTTSTPNQASNDPKIS